MALIVIAILCLMPLLLLGIDLVLNMRKPDEEQVAHALRARR